MLATLLEMMSSLGGVVLRPLKPCWKDMIGAPDQRICLMSSYLKMPSEPTWTSVPAAPRITLVTGPNSSVRPVTFLPSDSALSSSV